MKYSQCLASHFASGLYLGILLLLQSTGNAQVPSSRAQQVPFSSSEAGGVSAQQNTNPGAERSVNTIQSSVNTSGRFQGSILDPSDSGNAITLSLESAIERGLRFNLGAVSATHAVAKARGERLGALSQLLPSVTASVNENVTQLYLPAEGMSSSLFGNSSLFQLPLVTGQYHYYSLFGSINYNAVDLTAFRNLKAADAAELSSELHLRDAREVVILAVGGTYLQTLADAAVVEAQKYEIEFMDAGYQQAREQHAAGVRARIDVDRNLVELRSEQQRLASYEAELAKEKIRLARLIGLQSGTAIALSDALPDSFSGMETLQEAIQHGFAERHDLQAANKELEAAEQARKAARSEYLPTLSLSGLYGLQGTGPDTGKITYNGVASVNIPIWQGGRAKADTQQADASISERRAEYQNLKAKVEEDVRMAYIDAEVAAKQVQVARENQILAKETMLDSQDRFQAGVTDSVEVVQAHQIMASADRDYIASLYSQSLSRLRLAQAEGNAETESKLLFHPQ